MNSSLELWEQNGAEAESVWKIEYKTSGFF